MALVRRTSSSLVLLAALWLLGCDGGNKRRPIEMVPIPPPSAAPDPPPVADSTPSRPDSPSSSGGPQPLPTPVSGKAEPDAGNDGPTPVSTSEEDLKSALGAKGWDVTGNVQVAKKGAFAVITAEIRKGTVKGRVRLVKPRNGDPGDARLPYLPSNANVGVLVDAEGPRGADSYFYDKDIHTAGMVDLRPPGTRQEASELLRACFPFVH